MKKVLFFAIFASIILTGCFGGQQEEVQPENTWTSLIFPDINNEKRSKKHGIYSTLEQCQEASKKELARLDLTTRGTYKCGLNCSYHEGMKLDVCESLSK